jgi:hypothetical protein
MEQLALTCIGDNKRPAITDAMRKQAAEQLVQSMVRQHLLDEGQVEGSADDIVKATRYEQFDGYKIARELESRCHWDCDMPIAEAMEEFHGLLQAIYDDAENRWAADNPRGPEFTDGDAVKWRGQCATVHGVYERRPQCYKVRQGDMRPDSYYIAPFEEVS